MPGCADRETTAAAHRLTLDATVRPDGSVVIYPAHSTGELSRLNIASVGGGLERGLSRYASIRLEGSGFAVLDNDAGGLAYRVLAGISVPIGGYRANTIK